ncbi:hypothetical protein AMTRI_Chr06g171550 [Amborella trichopoda]
MQPLTDASQTDLANQRRLMQKGREKRERDIFVIGVEVRDMGRGVCNYVFLLMQEADTTRGRSSKASLQGTEWDWSLYSVLPFVSSLLCVLLITFKSIHKTSLIQEVNPHLKIHRKF